MPCNSDYLQAGDFEIEISQVACLLDELDGKKKINPSHWRGYHPDVYGHCTKEMADTLVEKLCDRLKGEDCSKRSLEMQMWWRDHKKADAKRKAVKK